MTQSSEKRDERREAILAAAWEVFSEKGFAGATMHEIAARAHASKETLYTWFGDKTRLFETLFRSRLKTVGATLAAEAGPSFAPETVLFIVARDLLRFMNTPGNMALYSVASLEATRSPELRCMLAESIDRKDFARYFERCKKLGLMEFEDAEEMASLFITMAQSEWPLRLAYGVIDRLTEKQIEKHARMVTRMFLKAVAPSTKS